MSAILRVEKQRTKADCAVCCLAMLLGHSYEEMLVRIGQNHPKILRQGLWTTEIMRVAEKNGTTLTRKRKFDLATGFGILCFSDHVVILKNDLVIDPADGAIWDADAYVEAAKEVPKALLQPVAEDI